MDARTAEALRDLAEEAGPALARLDRRALLQQLEDRHDELPAAMDWFIEQRRADDATRIATSLAPFWMATRRLDEGLQWFARHARRPRPLPASF
jgi:predicted ATPase